MICPCQEKSSDTAKAYAQCCEQFHLGKLIPQSPEQLMRSRYSAFYLALGQYIFDTHAASFRSGTASEYQESAESTNWCRLEIIESSEDTSSGKVNFKAYFFDKDKLHCLHEISNFALESGKWFYTDGEYQPKKIEKIQRNDPCPCFSGKKAKKCHLA